MPAQHFSSGPTSAPLASVFWKFGYTTIAIRYLGTLLTTFDDATPLRSTGLQGQAPDGSTLVVRLVPGEQGEAFQISRDGEPLVGSVIDFNAVEPDAVSAAQHLLNSQPISEQRRSRKPSAKQEKRIGSARGSLVLSGLLTVAVGALLTPDGVAGAVMAVIVGIGLLYIMLGAFATGSRAVPMLGIGSVVTALNFLSLVANLLRGGTASVITVGIGGLVAYRVYDGWSAAREISARRVVPVPAPVPVPSHVPSAAVASETPVLTTTLA